MKAITLAAFMTTAALLLAGCNDDVEAACVDTAHVQPDGSYQLLPDSYCGDNGIGIYHWYYGGHVYGSTIRSGIWTRPRGVVIVHHHTTVITHQKTVIVRPRTNRRAGRR